MASYLLTTKALMEFLLKGKSRREDFKTWCAQRDKEDLFYTSSICFGEARSRVEASSLAPHQKSSWRETLQEATGIFEGRILSFDLNAANEWANYRTFGATALTDIDGMLIGISRSQQLILVGPHKPAYDKLGIEIIDPCNGEDWN